VTADDSWRALALSELRAPPLPTSSDVDALAVEAADMLRRAGFDADAPHWRIARSGRRSWQVASLGPARAGQIVFARALIATPFEDLPREFRQDCGGQWGGLAWALGFLQHTVAAEAARRTGKLDEAERAQRALGEFVGGFRVAARACAAGESRRAGADAALLEDPMTRLIERIARSGGGVQHVSPAVVRRELEVLASAEAGGDVELACAFLCSRRDGDPLRPDLIDRKIRRRLQLLRARGVGAGSTVA
jgi:hypothetical protein